MQLAISFYLSDVFAFRVSASCEAEGCARTSGTKMGHKICAEHCECLLQQEGTYVYDPYKCGPCMIFIKDHFQGVSNPHCIKGALNELDNHVRKLWRYLDGLEQGFSTSVPQSILRCTAGVLRKVDPPSNN